MSDNGMELKDLHSEEERYGKREMGHSENGEKGESVTMVEGYNREKPPEDDCCPICFDDFHFPCRTSCGHWFCSSCILQHWRYSEDFFNPCKCPICGCLIDELVPESSVLIQPGEEVGKILKNIKQFNGQSIDGWAKWLVIFMRTVELTLFISKTLREGLNPTTTTLLSMQFIRALLSFLYVIFDLDFLPYGTLLSWLYFRNSHKDWRMATRRVRPSPGWFTINVVLIRHFWDLLNWLKKFITFKGRRNWCFRFSITA